MARNDNINSPAHLYEDKNTSTFEREITEMHEKDNNKHALQWFLVDITASKDKYCLDKQKVKDTIKRNMVHGHTRDGLHDLSKCRLCCLLRELRLGDE